MFQYSEKRTIPYTADLLFDVVMDIEAYPSFLPWCKAARIKSNDGKIVIADLIVGIGAVSEKFTSKVSYDKKKFEIITEYIDGPLEFMQSHWYLTPEGKDCAVDFSVELAFRQGWLHGIFQNLFEKATLRMMVAFEKQAATIKVKQ